MSSKDFPDDIDIDLEAQLYSQIHHDSEIIENPSIKNPDGFTPIRVVSNKSVVNLSQKKTNTSGNIPSNRYFMHGNKEFSSTQSGSYKAVSTFLRPKNKVDSTKLTTTSVTRTKAFTPYTPYLNSEATTKNNFNNSPKTNKTDKNTDVFNKNKLITTKDKEIIREKPFKESISSNKSKLDKIAKYNEKKAKAKQIRNRKEKNKIPTIILDSSDENSDDDDVIEIPLTPPPTVFIESSDESIISHSDFLPPSSKTKLNKSKIKINSRCTSPSSSVISDDFIIANDRSRLNISRDLSQIIDDEINDQPTVDSIITKKRKINKIIIDDKDNKSNQQKTSTEEDTYSEISDISFTKHIAGMRKQLNNKNITDSSAQSSSTEQIINDTNKTSNKIIPEENEINSSVSTELPIKQKKLKKLRKRKTSGSNKSSEYNTSSDENDDENFLSSDSQPKVSELLKTKKKRPKKRRLSETKKSSEVNNENKEELGIENNENSNEKSKDKTQKKTKRKKFDSVNASDDDFFSLLRKIVDNEEIIENKSDDEKDKQKADAKTKEMEINVQGENENEEEVNENSEGEDENEEEEEEEEEDENEEDDDEEENEETDQEEQFDGSQDENKTISNKVPDEFNVIALDNIETDTEESNSSFTDILINSIATSDEKYLEKETADKEVENYNIDIKNASDIEISNVKGDQLMVSDPESGWNNEMKYFYNESWGKEYNIHKIIGAMNANANWNIKNENISRKHPKKRCLNCNEIGHMKSKCPLPRKKCVCHLCGDIGHRASRCTKKLCLKCGASKNVLTFGCDNCFSQRKIKCNLCNIYGHIYTICPDKWRRYHSTINDNQPLETTFTTNKKKYCSVCAGSGHFADTCRSALRILGEPPNKHQIQNYTQSYKNKTFNCDDDLLMQNAFVQKEKNKKKVNFLWNTNDVKINNNGFYGRFLNDYKLEKVELKRKLEAKKAGMVKKRKTNIEKLELKKNQKEVIDEKLQVIDETNEINKNEIIEKEQSAELSLNVSNDSLKNYSFSEEIEKLKISINLGDTKLPSNEIQPKTIKDNIDTGDKDLIKDITPILEVQNKELAEIPNKRLECKTLFMQEMITQEQNELINPGQSKLLLTQTVVNLNLDNNLKIVVNQNTEERNVLIDSTKVFENFIPNCDSDSNYSFSELKNEIIETTENIKKSIISKPTDTDRIIIIKDKSLVKLPDYIPINSTLSDIDSNDGNSNNMVSIDKEEICKAKIFLSNEDSQILLSPKGNVALLNLIPKYQLTVHMEWHATGNVLCLTGVPSQQNKFQSELLEYILNFHKIEREKKSDRSIDLPRRRIPLINYIKNILLLLKKDFGNINVKYRKFCVRKDLRTKSSQRFINKLLTDLNIVLFGQNGLGDGKIHLDELVESLSYLENHSHIQNVSIEYRSKIFEHIKYIFSSFEHNDYEKFIDEYNNNRKSINTTFTPEHNIVRTIQNIIVVNDDNAKIVHTDNEKEESNNQITDKSNIINLTSSPITIPEMLPTPSPLTQMVSIPDIVVPATEPLLKPIPATITSTELPSTSSTNLKIVNKKNLPSKYWSNQCQQLIAKCRTLIDCKKNVTTYAKLDRVAAKAKNNSLTYIDYKVLLSIVEKLQQII